MMKSKLEIKVLRTFEDGSVQDLTSEVSRMSYSNEFFVAHISSIFDHILEQLAFIIFKAEGMELVSR